MDNARIRHNKILKEYMMNNNINSIYNIPYSPEYNPIEKIFIINLKYFWNFGN